MTTTTEEDVLCPPSENTRSECGFLPFRGCVDREVVVEETRQGQPGRVQEVGRVVDLLDSQSLRTSRQQGHPPIGVIGDDEILVAVQARHGERRDRIEAAG